MIQAWKFIIAQQTIKVKRWRIKEVVEEEEIDEELEEEDDGGAALAASLFQLKVEARGRVEQLHRTEITGRYFELMHEALRGFELAGVERRFDLRESVDVVVAKTLEQMNHRPLVVQNAAQISEIEPIH